MASMRMVRAVAPRAVHVPEPDDDPYPDPDEELPVAAVGALPTRKTSVAIQRLLDEVKAGPNGPSGYDRKHNRHMRS